MQFTLYRTFGYVYGKSTVFLWRLVGGGLLTLLPAMLVTLKARARMGGVV